MVELWQKKEEKLYIEMKKQEKRFIVPIKSMVQALK